MLKHRQGVPPDRKDKILTVGVLLMKKTGTWLRRLTACCLAGAACAVFLCAGCTRKNEKGDDTKIILPEELLPYRRITAMIKEDWTANWIWTQSGETEPDTWVSFRKSFEVSDINEARDAVACIAAESKYWLYINGEMAVREGGLKRGPTPEDGYYDTVEIGQYLREGENTIAALVWFWRDGASYSSTNSGKGGFLFEAELGGETLISDASWLAARNTAFLQDPGARQPNYRLPEANIYYDARRELTGWEQPGYDDSGWEAAKEMGTGGCAPWNALYERPIPLWKDFGLKDYKNSSEYENDTLTRGQELTMEVPYNAQLTPYLEVESEAGKEIVITTENTAQGSVFATYITKEGRQSFESPGWMNGERITYRIPKGVKIISLKYRESGYNTEFSGSFTCSDAFLNTLWMKSLRTLYITMRDNFMDCPDRERAQWWGDVTNEMAMSMYALDTNSYLLYQKGVATMLAYTDPATKVLQTVVPIRNDYFELPMQQLAGVCGFWTYYMYTGDAEFIKEVYPYAKDYVGLWTLGSDGLVVHRGGSWDWADWGSDFDMPTLENAWYYKALQCVIDMARLTGNEADIEELEQKAETVYAAYQTFWTEEGYKSASVRVPDDRSNAVAVLAGLADPDKYEGIRGNLTTVMHASPYMERYVLDALCEMGYMEDAQQRIRTRYKEMVEYDYSTLWEFWDHGGTLNHAWSGGPLLTMSQYMAGIEPAEAGYTKFSVKPMLGDLTSLECTVPSVRGYITVNISSEPGKEFSLSLKAPANTEAIVGIPRLGPAGSNLQIKYHDAVIYENGADCVPEQMSETLSFSGSDDQYLYYVLKNRDADAAHAFSATLADAQGCSAYTVRLEVGANGAVFWNGERLESGSYEKTVQNGEEFRLEAAAGDGAYFCGWSGAAGTREAVLSVRPQCDMTLRAEFSEKQNVLRTVTFSAEAECDVAILTDSGTEIALAQGTNKVFVKDGETVTFTARDGFLHRFASYQGDVSSLDNQITVTADRDLEIRIETKKLDVENVALGAAVFAENSLENNDWSVSGLTDGSLKKGYTTNVLQPDPEGRISPVSVTLDFGEEKALSHIALAPRTEVSDANGGSPNYPTEFTVSVSDDGRNFTEVVTIEDSENPMGVTQGYELGPQRAAYVRIDFTGTGTFAADEGVADPYRIQLMEIYLYHVK